LSEIIKCQKCFRWITVDNFNTKICRDCKRIKVIDPCYIKKCKICDREFEEMYGRKYCSIKCKGIFSNRLNAIKNAENQIIKQTKKIEFMRSLL